jgi:lipopolysaccharide export system ATP-binding protein
MSKLIASDIVKFYKKTKVLQGVSLEICSGESVSLLGPNGAGKTTLFYIICGLIVCDSGKVFIDDEDITTIGLSKKSAKGIAYLPQESSIFKDLTVEENIEIACEISIKDERTREARVEELLELLNIEPIRGRDAFMLSGGERRRVEIARSLAGNPKFLLLDEPFAGVDPIAVGEISKIIKDLKSKGIGIFITDHNFREALGVSDRAYVLHDGKVLSNGTPEEIYADASVQRYYLGGNIQR